MEWVDNIFFMSAAQLFGSAAAAELARHHNQLCHILANRAGFEGQSCYPTGAGVGQVLQDDFKFGLYTARYDG